MLTTSTSFPKTRWTLIQKVRSGTDQERSEALEYLCKAYWFPLYAFARKTGLTQQEAEDAVQNFMLGVLDTELFAQAEKQLGHLRTLLLTYFSNELRNLSREARRQKRGGDAVHVSIDLPDAEGRYQLEIASSDLPADTIYHRQWAESLVKRALERLQTRYESQGQSARFKVLRAYMPMDDSRCDAGAGAAAAGMSPAHFRVALHRSRVRYRQIIIDEVGRTIGSDDPALIQNEIQALFEALSH
jgi:DNA-directed RNA polymerase specialized sigma24 family protein